MIYPTIPRPRTLAVLLVVATVAMAGVATAGATTQSASNDEAEMTLTDAEGTVGETVTVEFELSGDGIAGYQAMVRYDPEVVSFESVTGIDSGGEATSPLVSANENGTVRFAQAGAEPIETGSSVAELTFSLEAAGSTDLQFISNTEERTSANNDDQETIPTTFYNGSITVTSDDGGDGAGSAGGTVGSSNTDDDDGNDDGRTDTEPPQTENETTGGEDRQTGNRTDEQRTNASEEQSTDGSAETNETDDRTGESNSDGLPGFGPLVAIAAVLTAASIAARRR